MLGFKTYSLKEIHIDKIVSSSLPYAQWFCESALKYKARVEIKFKEIDASGTEAAAIKKMLEDFSKLTIVGTLRPDLPDEVIDIIAKKLLSRPRH